MDMAGKRFVEHDPLQRLYVTSIQSENGDRFCQDVAQYLQLRLSIPTQFVNDIPWQDREQLLDTGQIHVGWICGLPYVWKADRERPSVELIAAPIMKHPRYRQRPIYFSDVIVHRDSKLRRFADLRGASWAYNEPHSQSGYNVTRYHLAQLGEMRGFFSRVVETGSHLKALEMVLTQHIEAAAIDSTVLELELRTRPHLKAELRVIESLGPSPIPPWVVSSHLSSDLQNAVRRAFWEMHDNPAGQAVLAQGLIKRMVRVEDRDYDPIRDMARTAAQVVW